MSSILLKQLNALGRRHLSTTTTATAGRLPWFVDPAPFVRQKAPHLVQNGPAPLPEDVPTVIKNLHASLKTSPHLDQSELLVCEPIPTPPGPPLPDALPKGRRKRGRTYAGEGVSTGMAGGLWNWIVLAQVSSPSHPSKMKSNSGPAGKGRDGKPRRNRSGGSRCPQIRKQSYRVRRQAKVLTRPLHSPFSYFNVHHQ